MVKNHDCWYLQIFSINVHLRGDRIYSRVTFDIFQFDLPFNYKIKLLEIGIQPKAISRKRTKKTPTIKIVGAAYLKQNTLYKVLGCFLALIIKNNPAIINGILSHCPVENSPRALSKPP